MNRTVVIVSIYKNDTLKQVQEMLWSLVEQTFKEFDIFVQFDGQVPKDIEQFLDAQLEKNVIKHIGKRLDNKGLAFSLNELINKALEEDYGYIFRMDADDICIQNRLELQYIYMEKNKDIDVCGGLIEEFNTDTNERQVVSYPLVHNDILQGMKKRNSMAHVTVCFRNTFFQKVELYDTQKKNEDYELWIRGFSKGARLANLDEVLVQVRTNNQFFARRKDIKRAYEVMMLKFQATKEFGFGMGGYIYAVAHFILFMMPGFLKKMIYKYMR